VTETTSNDEPARVEAAVCSEPGIAPHDARAPVSARTCTNIARGRAREGAWYGAGYAGAHTRVTGSIAPRTAPEHHRRMLIACGDCKRHVRDNETACPFCGADVTGVIATAPHWDPPRGMSRAALLALATATFGAAACSSSVSSVHGSTGPMYGIAAYPNGGYPNGGSGGALGTGGSDVVLYGGAPFPSGGSGGTSVDASAGGRADAAVDTGIDATADGSTDSGSGGRDAGRD